MVMTEWNGHLWQALGLIRACMSFYWDWVLSGDGALVSGMAFRVWGYHEVMTGRRTGMGASRVK